MLKKIILGSILLFSSSVAFADKFMDANWALKACDAWNLNTTLMIGLSGDKWMNNNQARGYKLIQIYRNECGADTKVQLNIEDKGGKASCTYGGVPDGKEINNKVDYVMHTTDKRWTQLGQGEYGPMKAMMLGRLKYSGPKAEAMRVMAPFGEFLKLTGSIAGDKGKENCPEATEATTK